MANEMAGKYDGTVLICGSAPCLLPDYRKAVKHRTTATVIAINDAASVILADILTTLHPDKAHLFRAGSLNKNIIVTSGQKWKPDCDVDFWMEGCNSGGTTAGSAIKVAKKMGFSEIILCGCPMTGGDGYFDAEPKANRFGMPMRFGNAPATAGIVRAHQKNLKREAQDDDYSMVRSMSGWTADLLGKPDFAQSGKTRGKLCA